MLTSRKLGSRFYVLKYLVTTETLDEDRNRLEGITFPFQMWTASKNKSKQSHTQSAEQKVFLSNFCYLLITFCKQFGPRSGPNKHFDNLTVFLKVLFLKQLILKKKNRQTTSKAGKLFFLIRSMHELTMYFLAFVMPI